MVWNFQESASNTPLATNTEIPASSIFELLRSVAHRMISDPGRILRPLTDAARDLCGADAAGICMERGGKLVAADTLPILLASGSCESLSGVSVPRAYSACAIALDENKPKLFQAPSSWLPVRSPLYPSAHGITAPWSAGNLRGTLWVLSHSDAAPFGLSKYRTLLTLANLVGSAVQELAERESWERDITRSTSELLTDTLLEQVQSPLQHLRRQLDLGMRGRGREASQHHLQEVADGLRSMSDRIDTLLVTQSHAF